MPANHLRSMLVYRCNRPAARLHNCHIHASRLCLTNQLRMLYFSFLLQHKGFALMSFTSDAAVSAAAAAVRSIQPWGPTATLGTARKVPQHWPFECTMTSGELAAHHKQQQRAAERREHNRRQRQRQQQRIADSMEQVLSGLPAPAGTAVLQQYQPLLGQNLLQYIQQNSSSGQTPLFTIQQHSTQIAESSHRQQGTAGADYSAPESSTCRTASVEMQTGQLLSTMPEPLRRCVRLHILQQLLVTSAAQAQAQPATGLIRLAAAPCVADVEAQLLFDWSKIPAMFDPAFGGQLADADVVRARQGKMNLRALRKRVQVESFALLLWQLTLPALADSTQLHVVDFGCGSGNLVLPLAFLFPTYAFTALDQKQSAMQLLQQRVQQGGLSNVAAEHGTIEDFKGELPACICCAALLGKVCITGLLAVLLSNSLAGGMYQDSSWVR
eukprot:GHRR01022396.1.p1 GENE.GHRR01022396.1~~GHRR01022396.1.p1  ORF type:complete len:441 (+),score=142.13 GHRR01022396.1:740-2062(+)